MIMRELTGGLYFGETKDRRRRSQMVAHDSIRYNEDEIRRIAKRDLTLQ